ncbi:MAG: CDGSH iron-sulfur domain-containing protein [Miltoncostaeaceae bacterium]
MAKRTYDGEGIRVLWDSSRCIHTMRCLTDEPQVFRANARPWVDASAAPAERIGATVERCPTGALKYERTDGAAQEERVRPTRVVASQDGPVLLKGDLRLETNPGELISTETRLTLCRCGKTGNSPFCDNQHAKTGFRDPGLSDGEAEPPPPDDPPDGPTSIRASEDGPILLSGDLSIESARARPVRRASRIALCRCGESANKPFCDCTHAAAGFSAPPTRAEPTA